MSEGSARTVARDCPIGGRSRHGTDEEGEVGDAPAVGRQNGENAEHGRGDECEHRLQVDAARVPVGSLHVKAEERADVDPAALNEVVVDDHDAVDRPDELEFVKIIYETSALDRRRKAGNPSESTILARFDGLKFCGVFIVI